MLRNLVQHHRLERAGVTAQKSLDSVGRVSVPQRFPATVPLPSPGRRQGTQPGQADQLAGHDGREKNPDGSEVFSF